MARNDGKPDSNYGRSVTLIDTVDNSSFAQEGDKLLGAAYVQLVDASGNPIVTFSGGTQYTDAAAAPANPVGGTIEWNEGGTWRTVSTAKPLPVSVIASLPAGTNAIGKLSANSGIDIGDVDITSIAAGDNNIGNVDIVTVPADPFGANADAAVAAGAAGSIQAKLRRATQGLEDLKSLIVLAAGTNAIGKLAANSGVDIGDVDVTTVGTITPGTAASSLGKAEDAAHTTGDVGVFALGVANEGNATRAADSDYISFATDTEGNQRVVGNRDHDAVDAGEVVGIGGFATTTNQTRVASGDRTRFIADLAGRQIANLGQVRELRGKQTTTITASTSETTIVTAAASTFKDLVALIVSNTSATAIRLDIRDTTAGTILFSLEIPATDVRGFVLAGCSIPQTTVNTNWTAQSSASVTDLRILAIFENNI